MIENPKEMPMNAGVVAVGADNQRDASLGSTERSYEGLRTGAVQLTAAVLLVREQDPRGPKNKEGPSILSFEGFGDKSRDGFITSNDTWVCSITVGER